MSETQMGVPAVVDTILDQPMDFTVIASSPKEMEAAQQSLILWAARKIQAMKGEIKEAEEQYELCRANKWNVAAWRNQIKKATDRTDFYRKMKAALEAGYYIVPPFPIDIFAIRTNRPTPQAYDSTHSDNHDQRARILPIGQGRYVDPKPVRSSYNLDEKQRDGTTKAITHWYATEFQNVEFPFKLAKADVRAMTDKAMRLKIFDQMGVLPRTRAPDPIVCGRILRPGQTFYRFAEPAGITFFVAWWLDTKTL